MWYQHPQAYSRALDLFIKIGFMLESIDIEIAIIQRLVWQNEIIESHHLDIEIIFLFGDFLHHRPDLLIDTRANPHLNMIRI